MSKAKKEAKSAGENAPKVPEVGTPVAPARKNLQTQDALDALVRLDNVIGKTPLTRDEGIKAANDLVLIQTVLIGLNKIVLSATAK